MRNISMQLLPEVSLTDSGQHAVLHRRNPFLASVWTDFLEKLRSKYEKSAPADAVDVLKSELSSQHSVWGFVRAAFEACKHTVYLLS